MSERIVDQINFIEQPCSTSCVSACIAMALNHPIEKLMGDFHEPYRALEIGVSDYLDEHGIPYECFWSDDRRMIDKDGVYFLTVPSLNIQAETHQVLGIFENNLFWVFDPNHGKEGKLYYVARDSDLDRNEVKIKGFVIDFLIPASYYREHDGIEAVA